MKNKESKMLVEEKQNKTKHEMEEKWEIMHPKWREKNYKNNGIKINEKQNYSVLH